MEGPGYPGKENGQLCEYPEHSREFYKWDSFSCKWRNIYDGIDSGGNHQSWLHKLTNNAAFEPWWGNNKGMDGIKNDRKQNGADDLWGDPRIRKFNSTFKQISADVMESIYNFTYDFRTVFKYYTELGTAFGYGNQKKSSSNSNTYTNEEEPKVLIKIKKVNRWEVGMAFGQYYESGMIVEKDSLEYV